MKKSLALTGLLVFAYTCLGFAGTSADICPEFADILRKHIVPELNTGLQKHLTLALQRNGKIQFSKPLILKQDLWKKKFLLKSSEDKREFDSVDTLQSELCLQMNTRISDLNPGKDDQIFVVLNPNTEAISNIMEDWSQKHVGIYKNMGLRVRWNSMSELQKSQKSFELKTAVVGAK